MSRNYSGVLRSALVPLALVFGLASSGCKASQIHVEPYKNLPQDAGNPEVGMVTAHGNGTVSSDATEAIAIAKAFERPVPVTAFKWATGHTLAAGGAIEAILTLLALRERRVPGIATLRKKASDCGSLAVSASEQKPTGKCALLISRAWASLTTCLVLGCD